MLSLWRVYVNVLSKGEQGIFNMCNDLNACCIHDGKKGGDVCTRGDSEN